jgi:S-(hydroxymethyl)glutathione dehydrogenase/alcohol dehydrogenase
VSIELCSVVESVGDEVTNLKEGDFILPTYIGECGECENCVSEKTNLCLTHPVRLTGLMPDNTSRLSVRGQKLYHVLSCATWSEYVVVDINYLVKVDPTIDLAYASFISCGFSTGYGASWKEANIQSGSTVAVFGLGAVGLGVCIYQQITILFINFLIVNSHPWTPSLSKVVLDQSRWFDTLTKS